MGRGHLPALSLAASALLCGSPAIAGNDDGVLLGNDAALAGGAVTAVVRDGSALWYNPAGVGGVGRDSVDVSASAFVVRAFTVAGFMSYATGERADGDVIEVVSIPSALTLVRELGPQTRLALGVFVPQSSDLVLRSKLDVPDESIDSTWILSAAETSSVYHVGAGLGTRLAPGVWIGGSLFGVYRSSFGWAQFWGGFEADGTTVAFLGATSLDSTKSVGLEAGLGLQWQIAPRWRLGVALRSPGLQLAESTRSTTLTGSSSVTEEGSAVQDFEAAELGELRAKAGLVSPTRVRAGLSYGGPAAWVALDADVQHGLDAELVRREATWNARVGGRVQLSPRVGVGLGLFTDRATEAAVTELGETRIDYYGFTAGVELSTAHLLERRRETARDLVFTTTLGVRYALGLGDIGGIRFDPEAPEDQVVSTPRLDVTVHEASVHLGSALYF